MKKVSKNYRAAPPVNGLMSCRKGHEWQVKNLNTERQAVNCPVCGEYTSIRQGLVRNDGQIRK